VVDADLYRPAGVDRARPAPAVLATNGFGGSKSDGPTDAVGRTFARRGCVGLVHSGLGFGKSGCLISLDDPDTDGRAASGLVDFLAGTRAADDGTRADFVTLDAKGDPRVGMIGGSYGGAGQLATADDKFVLFAELHDLAPDGTGTLVHRLVAPVRVPDVPKSFTVTLPGIVHRFARGHRLRFVIAASDDAYTGNRGIKPVTVVGSPRDTGVPELPVVGG